MNLIPLVATEENVNVKKGGVVTYSTGTSHEGQGIILLNNPDGEYGVVIVNQVHNGGDVSVMVRPVGQIPVKKFIVGDTVGYLATF